MTTFVLDASITMRWFFEAGTHVHADSILNQLTMSSGAAVVPILWRYEVSSVLARAQNKQAAPAQDVADFIEDLEALPIQLDPESGSRIFSDVHRVATTHRLTTYDAAYLELAHRRQLPLATLDAELIKACTSMGVPVI